MSIPPHSRRGPGRRWDGLAAVPSDHGPSVVTVGMFDGVHRGHRALLDRVTAEAAARGLPAGAVTFDRHPLEVLRPEARPPLLTTLDRKVALLGAAGMDFVLVLPFTEELSQVTAQAFAAEVLMDGVGARAIVVGENFRFGHKAAGDPALLAELGRPRGVEVVAVPLHTDGGEAVSSTRVRAELARGDVRAAAASLGRAYAVEGVVVRGDGRGRRQLGIPTANLEVAGDLALPANGVYAGHLGEEPEGPGRGSPRDPGLPQSVGARGGSPGGRAGPPRPAATSVGVNPQFHTSGLRVEAHVLDFDGDLLGAHVWVSFEHRLRDEAAFASVEDLVAQIHQDIRQARRLLRSGPGATVGPGGFPRHTP
jgi:riboflavin kinase / FMN adenylyltransferase